MTTYSSPTRAPVTHHEVAEKNKLEESNIGHTGQAYSQLVQFQFLESSRLWVDSTVESIRGDKTCLTKEAWTSIISATNNFAVLHFSSSENASVHLPSTNRFTRAPLVPSFPASADGQWGERIRRWSHRRWSSSTLGCNHWTINQHRTWGTGHHLL